MDVLLHTGLEHPELLWIVVPSLLSFALGLAAFVLSARLRALVGADPAGE